MESIYISGNAPLYGEVTIQGSKNAALPIMAAAVLIPGVSVLKNCPRIADVEYMCRILESIGCSVTRTGREVRIDASCISRYELPEKYVRKMRSSVILMGAMLARTGLVSLDYPGGCVIGDRPIDLHLKALRDMGIEYSGEGDKLTAAGKPAAAQVHLDLSSVGATENVLLAAAASEGETCIYGCAMEPEIVALCRFLRMAGARIEGEGTRIICIRGGRLRSCEYEIPADRIVAGTYLCACMAAGGEVFLRKAPSEEMKALIEVADRMGGLAEVQQDGLCVRRRGRLLPPGRVITECYPGFPTDLQSPLLAAMAVAEGKSSIEETIFNGRFKVVEGLNRMGADIVTDGRIAQVPGCRRLTGCSVEALELRGGAALVVAGVCAQGVTLIEGSYYIDRGYEDICRDLRQLGADIRMW